MSRKKTSMFRRMRPSAGASVLCVVLLLVGSPARAVAQERTPAPEPPADPYALQQGWFTRDKAYHFGISTLGSAALYGVGREAGMEPLPAILIAAGALTVAGLVREFESDDPNELLTRSHYSRRDLVWNLVGVTFGITITDRLFSHRWRPSTDPDENK